MATCYLLLGVHRRMDKLVETLGITGLSKSQVSVMARTRRRREAFRSRPLDAGPYPSSPPTPWCLKVREGGRVVGVTR